MGETPETPVYVCFTGDVRGTFPSLMWVRKGHYTMECQNFHDLIHYAEIMAVTSLIPRERNAERFTIDFTIPDAWLEDAIWV